MYEFSPEAGPTECNKVVASLRGVELELKSVNEEKERLQEKLMYTESAVAEANKAVQEANAENERLQEKLIYMESVVFEANKAVQEAKAECLQLKERLLDKENALQSITKENDEFRLREADAMKKIDELSALLAEAMTRKHPEEEEKLVVVDESHNNSVRKEVADKVAENEDTEGENDSKQKLELDAVNGNSIGDMNHEEEKDDTKVEQEEVKTECTVHESSKVVEKQPQTDRKQQSKSPNDELDSKKEDGSTEHANGTVSEDASKVGMSPIKPQQQRKKNNPY